MRHALRPTSADAANKLPGLEAGNMTYLSYLLHFPIQLTIVLGFANIGASIPLYVGAPAQNLVPDFFLRRTTAAPETAMGITK
jgi:hypothetical protein